MSDNNKSSLFTSDSQTNNEQTLTPRSPRSVFGFTMPSSMRVFPSVNIPSQETQGSTPTIKSATLSEQRPSPPRGYRRSGTSSHRGFNRSVSSSKVIDSNAIVSPEADDSSKIVNVQTTSDRSSRTQPYHADTQKLTIANETIREQEKKILDMKDKLRAMIYLLEDVKSDQNKLMCKYRDLKENHLDLEVSMQQLFFEDLYALSKSNINHRFVALELPVTDLKENSDEIGGKLLGPVLGSGEYAVVRECYCPTKRKTLAIKIIDKKKIRTLSALTRLDTELDVLKEFATIKTKESDGVLKLMDVMHTRNALYIITERLDRDLFDLYGDHPNGLTDSLARLIISGILSGLEFCHNRLVVHRDLKPENILLRKVPSRDPTSFAWEYDVVICDFGLCSRIDPDNNTLFHDFCGSPGFFAPEMFIDNCYDGKQADIWSVGCILLESLLGHEEFANSWMRAYSEDNLCDKKLFEADIKDAVCKLDDYNIPRIIISFIALMLGDLSGKNRTSVGNLRNHSWIVGKCSGRKLSNASSRVLDIP
jgi:hypothetical protein